MAKTTPKPRKQRSADRAPGQKRKARRFGPHVNHVDAQWGAAEMLVTFGQTRLEGGTEWPVEEIARVTLPIQTAKVLAFGLLTNIAIHETLLGPVNLARPMIPLLPTHSVLPPSTIARLAVIHAELFEHVPEPAKPSDTADVLANCTKH